MKTTRRKDRRPGASRAARRARPGWPVGRTLTAAALAVATLAVATWLRSRPAVAPAGPQAARPDSIAALEPWPAYQRALALGEVKRFAESLPYFRRALEVPPQAWEPHTAYATSLFQATHEGRAHLGWVQPVTRSSWERAAMMREAARQIEIAERLAKTPRDQAYVISARAQHLAVWGLSWDAMSQYIRATQGAPAESVRVGALAGRMRDPLRRD
jgi:hypothetical protein